jgi:thiol-disulfide isomerase/thioredoxin
MKIRMFIVFQVVALLFIEMTTMAVDHATSELSCPQSALQMQYSSGTCSAPVETFFPPVPDKTLPLLPKLSDLTEKKDFQHTTQDKAEQPNLSNQKTIIYFFWGKGCPHCEEERQFLEGITLGRRKLSEWQGRVLKLVSGAMMLGLGIILLINPALLNSVMVSFIILISALGVSLLVATLKKRLGY